MMTRLWIFALILAASSCVQAQVPSAKSPKTPTVSVSVYRAQLKSAIDKLTVIEARAPRNIAPILKSLSKTQIIKRADGQTQTASGDAWARWDDSSRAPKQTPTNVSRAEVQRLRNAIEEH